MNRRAARLDSLAETFRGSAALNSSERREAKEVFLSRVDGELELQLEWPRPARRWLWYAAPSALAVAVLLAVFFWQSLGELDYTVEGATRDGDYLRVGADHTAKITFSDDTRILAAPVSRLRIGEVSRSKGVDVALEEGSIHVSVNPAEKVRWSFNAGPFEVLVTGTRFDLSWQTDVERLELVLQEGSVVVRGYEGFGDLSVRAGQRFLGDARRRTMLVTELAVANGLEEDLSPTPAPGASSTAPSAASNKKPTETSETGSTLPSLAEPKSLPSSPDPGSSATTERLTVASREVTEESKQHGTWSTLVAKGKFRKVVDAAVARGVGDCLATCNGGDLSALADAARYVGKSTLAERTLMALRSRHASKYGARAAFLLGRLHERRGSMTQAKAWYVKALREGAGAFASEALAGKMRTIQALSGKAAARTVARDYLRRYPRGVDAAAAKQLLEEG